ncbi:MAG: NAD(P)-dependent oxidoreductase [Ignavibacteriae bacterium HGW-Ignavibacteriae-3]|nr:MAG: NAD(P)-dependent oxidoreductase [Ignavibacteriae bacterium HGW-Ignavibacteriae-3]
MKKISVVTGASGFVGSHIVDKLLSEGHEVRCLLRSSSSTRWLDNKDVKIFNCGLFDEAALKPILKDADFLFHIAGVVKAKYEKDYIRGNVETTRVLLDVICEVNQDIQKVVIVSSLTACGPSLDGNPVNEETPEHPITRYGRSKLAQEQLAKKYMDRLPITIIRPPAVFGERDTEIYLFFKTYKQGLMGLIGLNKKRLSLVYVKDLVNGIFLAATSSNSNGQIYFIGTEQYYDWDQIGEVTRKAIGKKAYTIKIPHSIVYTVATSAQFFAVFSSKAATFNIEKARDFVQPAWTCDVSKAAKELGYRQTVSLEDGIKRTVEWYRAMKWL